MRYVPNMTKWRPRRQCNWSLHQISHGITTKTFTLPIRRYCAPAQCRSLQIQTTKRRGIVHHQMWSRLSTWTRQLQVLRRYYQNQAQREYRRLQYLQLYAILSRSFSSIYADSMQLLTILVFIVNEWPFYGCQHQLNRNRMSCQKRTKQRNGHERWTWPLDMISVRSLSTDDPIELSHWLWEHIFEWWLW